MHAQAQVSDDRDNLQPGDRVVLIVEDDAKFAATLLDVARESGFKGVVAWMAARRLFWSRSTLPTRSRWI